jgi:hypothetical protein
MAGGQPDAQVAEVLAQLGEVPNLHALVAHA